MQFQYKRMRSRMHSHVRVHPPLGEQNAKPIVCQSANHKLHQLSTDLAVFVQELQSRD